MKLKEKVEYLFQKHNFFPQRSLSQNFLIDPGILSRLVEEIHLKEDDLILEIGAGTGILTSHLVKKAKKVWAVEIDEKLCQILKKELNKRENLRIICADITRLCMEKLLPEEEKIKVVGNLPYHIASWLMFHLVKKPWVDLMVFTIQREVAGKLLSPPGDKKRGTLTVLISYYADVERVIDVPPQAFYPSPRVGSTVIRIKPEKKLLARDEKLFLATVKAAFASRRKTLLNSLSRGLGVSREEVRTVLAKSGIPEKKRAEELKVEDFVSISNLFQEERIAR